MVDRVDATEEVSDETAVADVTLIKVDIGTHMCRAPPAQMNGGDQRVEHHDIVSVRDEPVTRVRSDEPCPPDDEDLHFRR